MQHQFAQLQQQVNVMREENRHEYENQATNDDGDDDDGADDLGETTCQSFRPGRASLAHREPNCFRCPRRMTLNIL